VRHYQPPHSRTLTNATLHHTAHRVKEEPLVYVVVRSGDQLLIAYALEHDAEAYAAEAREQTGDSVEVVAVEIGETDMGIHDAA